MVVRRLDSAAQVEVGGERLPFDDLSPEQMTAYLDSYATAFISANDGVRPSVRVLERVGFPSGRGAAGSVPR